MAYWPDVTRGEKVRHHMLLENNIRHMINSLDGFGSTPNRGSSNGVVRIPIWNASNAAFSAGQPVAFDSAKALCGDAVPAVPVTDKKKPWGVCEKYIEPNGIGECIISGYARVSITGSNGDKAEPYGSGTSFIRGNSGVPIIWHSVSDGVGIIHLGGGGNNAYSGQWAVQLDGAYFKVPASAVGNLILTEDRVFYVVTNELLASNGISENNTSWCYLRIDMDSGTPISLETYTQPIQHLLDYADYTQDYIPLAVYSQETGLIQLQYGPVRLNRYWVYDTGAR